MSFYNSQPSSYKPQVRVEGFQVASSATPPGSSGTTNSGGSNGGANLNDLFPPPFLHDSFRKFPPGGSAEANHAFNEDLVSLMNERGSAPGQSGAGGANGSGGGAGAGSGGGGYDDGYHRTHNIFDVSSPIPVGNPNGAANGPGSQSNSLHSPSTSLHDYHNHPPPHFNSTLPALNSSMRYEPPPENHPLTPSSPQTAPNGPSSYHAQHGFTRHTPSPAQGQAPIAINGRPRSHSRPPSAGNIGPSSLNSGGVGPARTTRARRGNSLSGPSPPPIHSRPHAILIPNSGPRNSIVGPMSAGGNSSSTGNWFIGSAPTQSSADSYLPTPESLGSHHSIHSSIPSHHHSHSHSQSQTGYGPFSLSPPSNNSGSDLTHHLPPLHQMAHSLPKSSIDHHHLSGGALPKSPLDHPYPSSSYGLNGGAGESPPGASPGSLPTGGLASMNTAGSVGGVTPTGGSYALNPIGGMSVSMGGGAAGGAVSSMSGSVAVSPQDKQAQIAHEKRRRRRESHNAVERRRRDNINEKISELATLIPECMLEGAGPPNAKDTGVSVTPPLTEDALIPKTSTEPAPLKQEKDDDGTIPVGGDTTVVKANKGMILRKSVEYIRYLQQLVTAQGARNRELEQQLRQFRGESVSSDSSGGGEGSTSTGNAGADYDSLFTMHDALTLDNLNHQDGRSDDNLELIDADDAMSLADTMVLHDEFSAAVSPTLSTISTMSTSTASGVSSNSASKLKGSVGRKSGHQRQLSASSRPKNGSRLPPMPEEDMEVDKGDNAHGSVTAGMSSPEGSGHGHGDGQQQVMDRSRASHMRTKEEVEDQYDLDHGRRAHEHGDDHGMRGMEMNGMFGMMNGHGGHHGGHHAHHQQHQHQQHHHHEGVMGW